MTWRSPFDASIFGVELLAWLSLVLPSVSICFMVALSWLMSESESVENKSWSNPLVSSTHFLVRLAVDDGGSSLRESKYSATSAWQPSTAISTSFIHSVSSAAYSVNSKTLSLFSLAPSKALVNNDDKRRIKVLLPP